MTTVHDDIDPRDSLLFVDGLSKRYELRRVLNSVSLNVAAGQTLLLLGHNGAGKTTLMNIVTGRMQADAGRVTVAELDVRRKALNARALIGFVGHDTMLHGGLTVRENIRWFANMLGMADVDARIRELCDQFEMRAFLDQVVGRLSDGQRKRASLARALVGQPKLLLLDEPFAGLDEPGRNSLTKLIADLGAADRAILLTTHDTELGLSCATHVAHLSDGRIGDVLSTASDDANKVLCAFRAKSSA